MIRGKKAISYIFFETLPGFLIGLLVFVLIILMFQVLRLTEFALIHGVGLKTVMEIIAYICISMLPVLFPMSLLFAVIMTYSRLSQDSEIIAMKASGLSLTSLVAPALVLGLLVALVSSKTTFQIAPWGNRQFEVLYSSMANNKAAATIKAGTFSEGFFDLVVYANEVDTNKGDLKNVFIYNERDPSKPMTIIAKKGQIIPDPLRPGQSVVLHLLDGDIHRKSETHTKIKFDKFDLQLFENVRNEIREKSSQSYTMNDIKNIIADPKTKADDLVIFITEFHKRWAIAVMCLVFAMIGVGLGMQTNRRQQKAGGLVLCLGVIIVYWVLYVTMEGFARNGQLKPAIAIWFPNTLFGLFSLYLLWKQRK